MKPATRNPGHGQVAGDAGRARLIDWVRDARTMPWEGDVIAVVADNIGSTPLAVRCESFHEDLHGRPLPPEENDES